jgi:hypothetical protein
MARLCADLSQKWKSSFPKTLLLWYVDREVVPNGKRNDIPMHYSYRSSWFGLSKIHLHPIANGFRTDSVGNRNEQITESDAEQD